MVTRGSKLVMVVLAVVVAITTLIGVRPVAAQGNDRRRMANGRSEHPSDRDPGRDPPGICGTPWAEHPELYKLIRSFPLGKARRVGADTDQDGLIDTIYFDYDWDGIWDAAWILRARSIEDFDFADPPLGYIHIWVDKNNDGKIQYREVTLWDLRESC